MRERMKACMEGRTSAVGCFRSSATSCAAADTLSGVWGGDGVFSPKMSNPRNSFLSTKSD